jgi:D-arginine dehydrogenase
LTEDLGTFDFLVIGAGIAGASAAYELAKLGSVLLLEREEQPGYHTSGRSAAVFTETYGPPVIRNLVACARPFFENPPPGFAEHPLLSPRGELFAAPSGQEEALEETFRTNAAQGVKQQRLTCDEALARHPLLKPESAAKGAIYVEEVWDMDAHALLQGFLKGYRSRGGKIAIRAELLGLERQGDLWHAQSKAGKAHAPYVINAAGAWGDEVAKLAGIAPLGLEPRRRTVITLDPPNGIDPAGLPLLGDADVTYYMKPDAGRLLCSLAEATPHPPCDVQPEEEDIALLAWRLEEATTLQIRRIASSWAGLRTFVPDDDPAIGEDPDHPGFFWLVGQGGYGIKTAPPLSRAVASLLDRSDLPADLKDRGIALEDLHMRRLR